MSEDRAAKAVPRVVIGPPRGPGEVGIHPPMAMVIAQAEQDHQAAMRQRSWELALQRGHVRR